MVVDEQMGDWMILKSWYSWDLILKYSRFIKISWYCQLKSNFKYLLKYWMIYWNRILIISVEIWSWTIWDLLRYHQFMTMLQSCWMPSWMKQLLPELSIVEQLLTWRCWVHCWWCWVHLSVTVVGPVTTDFRWSDIYQTMIEKHRDCMGRGIANRSWSSISN